MNPYHKITPASTMSIRKKVFLIKKSWNFHSEKIEQNKTRLQKNTHTPRTSSADGVVAGIAVSLHSNEPTGGDSALPLRGPLSDGGQGCALGGHPPIEPGRRMRRPYDLDHWATWVQRIVIVIVIAGLHVSVTLRAVRGGCYCYWRVVFD